MAGSATTTVTNLAMFVGEQKQFIDTIYKADGTTPQDLTGYGLAFRIIAYADPSTVFVEKTTAGGGIDVPIPANGQAIININEVDTQDMIPTQYEYVVVRNDPSNYAVLSRGLLTLMRE